MRSADPAYLARVQVFYRWLFGRLRAASLTAGQGGPIVMAQIENEFGSFSSDHAYLVYLRDLWRAGLGDGVVIHSTDGPVQPLTAIQNLVPARTLANPIAR